MNNKTKYITLSFATVLLFWMNNCNEQKKEETYRTITYFDKHTDIRNKRVLECKSLKDMTELSAKDCANANFSARSGKPVDTSNW